MADKSIDLLDSFAPYPGVGRGQRFEGKPAADTPDWFEAAGKPSTFPAEEPMPPWQANWGSARTERAEAAPAAPVDVSLGIARTDAPAPTAERGPSAPAPVAAPSRGEVSALARSAMSLLSPDALVTRLAQLDQWQGEIDQTYAAEREATAPIRARLAQERDQLVNYMRDYRQTLSEMRPKVPEVGKELRAAPPVPDVRVRPWLDPEGKSVIQTIVQGLGALATGISGLVVGAPKTALAQFREAAEAWRRDEVDAASSKLQEFHATMQQIDTDNRQAWGVYDAADRKYGANVAAKQAAAVTMMHELNLEEQTLATAAIPFEEQRTMLKARMDTTEKITKELGTLFGVMARLKDAKAETAKLGTTPGQLAAQRAQLRMDLEQTQDPDEKRQIERRLTAVAEADASLKAHAKDTNALMVQNQLAGKILAAADKQIEMSQRFRGRVTDLVTAYTTLHEQGLLPPSHQPWDKGSAWIRQNFGAAAKRPEVVRAMGVIEQFTNPVLIGSDRLFLEDKNARTKEAYGRLQSGFLPFDDFMGVAEIVGNITYETEAVSKLRRDAARTVLGTSLLGGGTESE